VEESLGVRMRDLLGGCRLSGGMMGYGIGIGIGVGIGMEIEIERARDSGKEKGYLCILHLIRRLVDVKLVCHIRTCRGYPVWVSRIRTGQYILINQLEGKVTREELDESFGKQRE
jgi:uncharacterized protein YebE (UPF0316 family)